MAAIDIHIGQQDAQDRQDDSTCAVPGQDGQLGGPRSCVPALAATHAGQERMVWIRRSLEDALKQRRVQVLDGATMGLKGVDAYRLYFTLDPPLQQYELPWMPAARKEVPYVALFGEAQKMAAPTWDLPAGSPVVGGACPGATAGQTSVPVQIRSRVEKPIGQPVRIQETICQICLSSDAQVLVNGRGWMAIGDLHREGREFSVWSGKAWRRTYAVMNGEQSIVELGTTWGATLRCTPDHKILTAHRGMVEARHLVPGDELAYEQHPEHRWISVGGCSGGVEPQCVKYVTGTSMSRVPVYDLVNVGKEHQFVANGISVSNCYAEGGNYQSPHVQAGEIIRYWWSRAMTAADEDWERARNGAWMFTPTQEQWIQTVVRALQGESWKPEVKRDPKTNAIIGPHLNPRTGRPLFPVRVHSSGDFFSLQYARCWVEVCNRVPEVEFWAPTRTWAAAGWIEAWAEMMPYIKHGNLSIRPSAYHTDDPAPNNTGRMVQVRVMTPTGPTEDSRPETPWGPGGAPMSDGYPFTAAGTTAVYKDHDANQGRDLDEALRRGEPNSIDPRYQWSCRTYSILDDAHSCANAVAPDGNVGCRACWVHRDMTVNYTAH